MVLNHRTARPGDQFTLAGRTYIVHNVSAPGSTGLSFAAGPIIDGWVRPGGHGVTIDETTVGVDWVQPQTRPLTIDVAAGIQKAQSLGYTEIKDQMVVEAALYRFNRGDENSAKNLWLSKFPYALAAWDAILAAAQDTAASPTGSTLTRKESGAN